MCVWVSGGVHVCVDECVCIYVKAWTCTSLYVWELVCVCAFGCERAHMCKHTCVWMCVWAREREKVVGELKRHQRADLPQLDPSRLCLELPRWRLFLIFHMPLTQLLHFLGRRMECAQSRRALRDVWLSGLFKGQETRGWSFAHGLIWIHISPYTHPYVPCPQNKQQSWLSPPLCLASPGTEKS